MVKLCDSCVQHVDRQQLLYELKLVLRGDFEVQDGSLGNHVCLIIYLFEGPEFFEIWTDQSLVKFKGPFDRLEMNHGFVFVTDDEFVTDRELI